MATDIKISELNEVTCNNPLNHIIINDRESASDEGITKKISLDNFFTSGIVKESTIAQNAVTNTKIKDEEIDCSKIAAKTITCNQIKEGTICRNLLTPNIITNCELHNDCNYSVGGLLVTSNCVRVSSPDGCIDITSGVTELGTIRYSWPQSQSAGYFLKTDGSGSLTWDLPLESNASSLVFEELLPVGTIIPWAGANSSIPNDKWLVCNGATFDSSEYPDLATVVADTYGTHSGSTYYLPNLQGRVVMGEGTATDTNNTTRTFAAGNCGGSFSHQLVCSELPAHNHDNGAFDTLVTRDGTGTTRGVDNTTPTNEINLLCGGSIQPVGGNALHNNIQPYLATGYIIKAKKDKVQQFKPTLGKGLSATDTSGQVANLELSATEIGIKIDETLKFDGGNKITVNPNLTADSIKFGDGSLQTVAPVLSAVVEGLVGDGLGGANNTVQEVDHGLGRTPSITQFFWKCKSIANNKNFGYELGTELYITSQSDSGLGHSTTAAGPTKIYHRGNYSSHVYTKRTGNNASGTFRPSANTDNWELRYRAFA